MNLIDNFTQEDNNFFTNVKRAYQKLDINYNVPKVSVMNTINRIFKYKHHMSPNMIVIALKLYDDDQNTLNTNNMEKYVDLLYPNYPASKRQLLFIDVAKYYLRVKRKIRTLAVQ